MLVRHKFTILDSLLLFWIEELSKYNEVKPSGPDLERGLLHPKRFSQILYQKFCISFFLFFFSREVIHYAQRSVAIVACP